MLQALLIQNEPRVMSYNLTFDGQMGQYVMTILNSAFCQTAFLAGKIFTWSSRLEPWGALGLLLALLEEGVAAGSLAT